MTALLSLLNRRILPELLGESGCNSSFGVSSCPITPLFAVSGRPLHEFGSEVTACCRCADSDGNQRRNMPVYVRSTPRHCRPCDFCRSYATQPGSSMAATRYLLRNVSAAIITGGNLLAAATAYYADLWPQETLFAGPCDRYTRPTTCVLSQTAFMTVHWPQ
jgi:hypothetical protein